MKRKVFNGLRFNDAVVVTDDVTQLLSCCVKALDNDTALKDDDKRFVFGNNRTQRFVDRRHVLMTLSLKYGSPLTITDIGNMFNRNHATVLHARQKCVNLMGLDRHFTKIFNQYEDHFKHGIK